MPALVTVAWLVLSVRTFLKRCMCRCVLQSLTSGCMALTFTPGKEPDAIIYPHPSSPFCLFPRSLSVSKLGEVSAGICHLCPNLNRRDCKSYLFLSPRSHSIFIPCSASSLHFSCLRVVESLPNEVADGSILQRDRVEQSPTLKSINLTVSIRCRQVWAMSQKGTY